MITILGLGYGAPGALTMEAREVLDNAREIFLRTRDHPAIAALPKHLRVHSFDARDADAIVNALIARGDAIYAVPGHPLFGEPSVREILTRARNQNISTRVIAGTSFVDATCAALALDPLARGMVIADATDLARQHFPHLDPDQPALIGQLSNRDIARDLLRVLRVLYPRDHIVTRVDAAGTRDQKVATLALAELDRTDDFGLLTTLYVPPLARPSGINALAEIIAHLRAPNGCPWDREQTHQSLSKDFLEECYEVLETLDANDIPHLREELGDLMLHIIFQTQIASESSEFLLSDVIADVSEKLIRRHPHVFGDVQVNGKADVIANWDKIKQAENGGKKKSKMPRGLPALMRAQKVAKKMTTNSGNTTNLKNVAARVEKLSRAKNRGRALGEILFALAAYAQAKHIDAESAFRTFATEKAKNV